MKTVTTYNVIRLKPVRGIHIERVTLPTKELLEGPHDVDVVATLVDLEKYRYFWFESMQMTRTQKDNNITFVGKVLYRSGKFFINAFIEEYCDVVVNNQELAKQMTNLGWTHIVKNIGVKEYWIERFDPEKDRLVEYNGK